MGGHVAAIEILATKTADGGAEAELELEDGAVGKRLLVVLFWSSSFGRPLLVVLFCVLLDRTCTEMAVSFTQDRLGTRTGKALV